jgi:SP family general alpha glucoside:H+ symporter-like MFS transporter
LHLTGLFGVIMMAEQEGKRDIEMVERTTTTDEPMATSKGENPLMRSKEDDLSIWYSALRFKRVGCIAMIAAFCAALDGYRKTSSKPMNSKCWLCVSTEINLNGGIIANKGFIKQFAAPGTTVILGKYISAWGGIQSAGQFVGQVVRIS